MASQHGHHIIPKKTLYKVFGALVLLTILTALTAEFVDIGALNVPLAIAIAGSKAALVATFFMALKYDNKVNTLVFMLGLIFVGVFLIFTLFDTVFRGDLGNVGSETISQIERLESAVQETEQRHLDGTSPESVPEDESEAPAGTPSGGGDAGQAVQDTTAAADTSGANNAQTPE